MARGALIDGPHAEETFRGFFVIAVHEADRKDETLLEVECERCGCVQVVFRQSALKRNRNATGCPKCRGKRIVKAEKNKGGRPRIPPDVAEQIVRERKEGETLLRLADRYNVNMSSVQRLVKRAQEKECVKATLPAGTTHTMGYINYRRGKRGMIFVWHSEYQEWVRSAVTPSELGLNGKRVG